MGQKEKLYTKIGDEYVEVESGISEDDKKEIACDFFYYWWNTGGTNTQESFDEWWETARNEYIEF